MRVQINKTIDSRQLAAELTAVLGVPVAVSARNPGQFDARGNPLPGLILLVDPRTGRDLPDQGETRVAEVVAAHTPVPEPEPPKTPAKTLAEAIGAATNFADLKAALVAYAGGLVAREEQVRKRRQRGRR